MFEARPASGHSGDCGYEWSALVAHATVMLFFFQLITSFVAANYAFGLLNERLPPESISAVFLLSPLLLTLPLPWSGRAVPYLVPFMVLTRFVYPFIHDTLVVILVTGLGVAASLLILVILLSRQSGPGSSRTLAVGLLLAVTASVALRCLGSGLDASTSGPIQLLVWPAGVLAVLWSQSRRSNDVQAESSTSAISIAPISLGLTAVLALLYFGFTAPNVIAGWTGVNYLWINGLILSSGVVCAPVLQARFLSNWLSSSTLKIGISHSPIRGKLS